MPDFLLVRHAPTDWNRERRMQGRADRPLSPEGREEAMTWRLPDFAASWPCRSSPLSRAMETAKLLGLAPEPDAAFTEMDWGGFEGQTLEELRADPAANFAANEARGLDFRADGGESPREVGHRVLAGLSAQPGDAVIVTHKGVIRALLALALDWDMRGRPPVRPASACAHRFRLKDGLLLVQANIPLAGGVSP